MWNKEIKKSLDGLKQVYPEKAALVDMIQENISKSVEDFLSKNNLTNLVFVINPEGLNELNFYLAPKGEFVGSFQGMTIDLFHTIEQDSDFFTIRVLLGKKISDDVSIMWHILWEDRTSDDSFGTIRIGHLSDEWEVLEESYDEDEDEDYEEEYIEDFFTDEDDEEYYDDDEWEYDEFDDEWDEGIDNQLNELLYYLLKSPVSKKDIQKYIEIIKVRNEVLQNSNFSVESNDLDDVLLQMDYITSYFTTDFFQSLIDKNPAKPMGLYSFCACFLLGEIYHKHMMPVYTLFSTEDKILDIIINDLKAYLLHDTENIIHHMVFCSVPYLEMCMNKGYELFKFAADNKDKYVSVTNDIFFK